MGQVRTYDICKELSLTKIFWTINVMLSWLEFFQLLQEYPSQTCRDSKSLKKITGILMQVLQLPQFSPVFTGFHQGPLGFPSTFSRGPGLFGPSVACRRRRGPSARAVASWLSSQTTFEAVARWENQETYGDFEMKLAHDNPKKPLKVMIILDDI